MVARRLRYSDLCLIGLVTADPFPDTWIYPPRPGVRAGRAQDFGAWSEGMTKPGTTSLGVEYFCFRGDRLWELDAAAVELATRELASIGLLDRLM